MTLPQKRALIVGVGGLGCPAAWELARTGGVRLTLLDDDRVDESNLHRQILYSPEDIGQPKVAVARQALLRQFPGAEIEARHEPLTRANARALFAAHEVVLDGTDDPEIKFLCSDVAIAVDVPLIHAGVIRFQGMVFPVRRGGACLRCLFESEPESGEVLSCSRAGILGAVAGVVGALQASEARQILRGPSPAGPGELTTLELKRGAVRRVASAPRADCPTCSSVRLDITAERCPMTYVRTKLRLEQLEPGDVLDIVLQGDEPLRNVPRSLADDGHRVRKVEQLGDDRSFVQVEKRGPAPCP